MSKKQFTYTSALGLIASSLLTIATAPISFAFDRSMQEGVDAARGVDQVSDLFGTAGVFTTITNLMLFVIGAISVIMIVIGGLRYVISGGNTANVTAAKNTILYAIVGLIVAMLAYAMINFVIGSFTPDGGMGSGGTNV